MDIATKFHRASDCEALWSLSIRQPSFGSPPVNTGSVNKLLEMKGPLTNPFRSIDVNNKTQSFISSTPSKSDGDNLIQGGKAVHASDKENFGCVDPLELQKSEKKPHRKPKVKVESVSKEEKAPWSCKFDSASAATRRAIMNSSSDSVIGTTLQESLRVQS